VGRLHELLEPDTAGDPMTGLKWTRKTTRKISEELGKAGLCVSHTTVARLLEKLDYRLRVNHKKIAGNSHPQRNTQFEYIAVQRRRCERSAIPLISIDTKKKEVVGPFKNAGAVWSRSPRAVRDHDFRSEGVGMAIPYGIYDVRANRGAVFVGKSHDTADFALDSLAAWWRTEGSPRYPKATQLFILADNGGSNGSTHHAWRYALQRKLADPFGLTLTVCHYPPATSKWNPIEHRLFAQISRNWAGEPLTSYETIVNFIRKTTTETGLRVTATTLEGDYPTGVKIAKHEMKQLSIRPHDVCPQWNYTIRPRCAAKCEVIS
jgi:Rhodopirellula transposase DDE domain